MELKNECRMFLHAVTLSDIVTADGWEISMNTWNGRHRMRKTAHTISMAAHPKDIV
jgi:hypothetical protein